MPDNSSKNQTTSKNEPKDQRKPRYGKVKGSEKAKEIKTEISVKAAIEKKCDIVTRSSSKVKSQETSPLSPQDDVSGNDDTLNISGDSDAKYKKKEITSNWAKYEAPIETYEEYEELEEMGSDYEKLIQASMSVGGHFQFKHEKSWNISTAPSLYDKYFDMHTDDLAVAVSTIPFYERNGIDKTLFAEGEITNMETRTSRFKQKYYNDNSYTPDMLAKTIDSLKEGFIPKQREINLEDCPKNVTHEELKIENNVSEIESGLNVENSEVKTISINQLETNEKEKIEDIDDIIFGKLSNEVKHLQVKTAEVNPVLVKNVLVVENNEKALNLKPTENPAEAKDNTKAAESPEDLEKWLDDFLDG